MAVAAVPERHGRSMGGSQVPKKGNPVSDIAGKVVRWDRYVFFGDYHHTDEWDRCVFFPKLCFGNLSVGDMESD